MCPSGVHFSVASGNNLCSDTVESNVNTRTLRILCSCLVTGIKLCLSWKNVPNAGHILD